MELNPGFARGVFKAPAAQVAIEYAPPAQSAKEQITPAIAVDIAGGDTGAVQQNMVGERTRLGERVGEEDAGLCAEHGVKRLPCLGTSRSAVRCPFVSRKTKLAGAPTLRAGRRTASRMMNRIALSARVER